MAVHDHRRMVAADELPDLLRLQLTLERKGLDPSGRVVRVPGPDTPDDIARIAVVYTDGRYLTLVRHDVPTAVADGLGTLGPERAFADTAGVTELLAPHGACEHTGRGASYICTTPPPGSASPDVAIIGPGPRGLAGWPDPGFAPLVHRRPVFAVLSGGRAVAACVSVRENDEAAEAWVVTDPVARGRGYARQVVAAWARATLSAGKTPFYSHDLTNHPSAGVARTLGLERWMIQTVYV